MINVIQLPHITDFPPDRFPFTTYWCQLIGRELYEWANRSNRKINKEIYGRGDD